MMVTAKSTIGGTITQNFVQNGILSLLSNLAHYREKHRRKQQKNHSLFSLRLLQKQEIILHTPSPSPIMVREHNSPAHFTK